MIEMNKDKDKILLMLLPFWTPLIPPLGISCLKSSLETNGFHTEIMDTNIQNSLWDEYYAYNNILKKVIPAERQGNFYNSGHHVLRHHLMAYINRDHSHEYYETLKEVVYHHYYHKIGISEIKDLDNIIERFYVKLEKSVIDEIEAKNPKVIGISTYTGTLPATLFIFKLIKSRYPHIYTIMGGGVFADQLAVGSPDFNEFIQNTPFIDYIIIGEAESLFVQLLNNELPIDKKVYTINDCNGHYVDLHKSTRPDFTGLDIPSYSHLATFVSRSCPFQCAFCSETVQWGKFRRKEVKQVGKEFSELYQQYRSQLFLLGDSLLNPFIDELSDEMIRNNYSFYFDGYLRADIIVCNRENTLKWRRAGYYRARLGVESGSQKVLDLMNKKITVQIIKDSLKSLANAGIKTTTYWVIGFPGETEKDFQDTLDLITEMKDYIWEAECNAFWYYLGAQVSSDFFYNEYGISRLYPEYAKKYLLMDTWIVNTEPERNIIYERVRRFIAHCENLNIPNPYNMKEIYLADRRWKSLHENAVPAFMDFKNSNKLITENLYIK